LREWRRETAKSRTSTQLRMLRVTLSSKSNKHQTAAREDSSQGRQQPGKTAAREDSSQGRQQPGKTCTAGLPVSTRCRCLPQPHISDTTVHPDQARGPAAEKMTDCDPLKPSTEQSQPTTSAEKEQG
jgi:hypothetical protein